MLNNKEYKKLFFSLQTLASDIPENTFKKVFEWFVIYTMIETLSDNSVVIPGIGKIKIRYEGDKRVGAYKESVLSGEIEFDDLMKKLFGQVADGESSEVHEYISNLINNDLKCKV